LLTLGLVVGCGSHATTYHFRATTRCLGRNGWVVNVFNPSSRLPAVSARAFGSFFLMDFQDTPAHAADLAKTGRQVAKGFVERRGNLVVIWHAKPPARTKAKVYACLR
jgi:hypothetical protein